jgi:hypothetical protein
MNEPLILDNTKRSTYRQCKKKYFLQHMNGWQSIYGSTAIRYGVTWHGIQEGFHQWVKENGWPTDPEAYMTAITAGLELGKIKWDKECEGKQYFDDFKNFNTAVDGFNAYLDYFSDDKNYLKILSTERKFECPIEAENELEYKLLSNLPPIVFTGRIDLCVEMDHMKWIWDFKTTGWYLDKVIQESNRSPQMIGYSYAGKHVLDFEPNGCLLSFAYLGATKSKKTGEYGGVRFDFRRVPQLYTDSDIAAWKLSFIDTCADIKRSEENNLWSESFDNCYRYGQCQYLRLCKQDVPYEELNFEGFVYAPWNVLDDDEV